MTTLTRARTGLAAVSLTTAAVVLAACGGSTEPPAAQGSSNAAPPSGASSQGSTSAPAPSSRVLRVTVSGRSVTPAPSQVHLGPGETLTLVITSDHDDEVHAHGFEVEKELKAGVPTTLTLRSDLPGVYEVETHHPSLRLLSVAVQ